MKPLRTWEQMCSMETKWVKGYIAWLRPLCYIMERRNVDYDYAVSMLSKNQRILPKCHALRHLTKNIIEFLYQQTGPDAIHLQSNESKPKQLEKSD